MVQTRTVTSEFTVFDNEGHRQKGRPKKTWRSAEGRYETNAIGTMHM